jgi:cytochrome c-type biogenesis protein CcmH
MVLWAILAVLTAIVITVVCLPLVRPKGQQTLSAQSDAQIYKAQLAEIEDERARGIISDSEAEAARIEVSRRLLRSAEKGENGSATGSTAKENDRALVLASVLVPALALGGYLIYGGPSIPQQPYAARFDNSPEAKRVAEMVERVEERLREHPRDGAGWDVIAPVYLRQQQYHDAVFAFQQALRLNGESAARLEGLGEAMVLRDNGQVNQTARMAFERALQRNPESLKAQFWVAVSDEQDGNYEQAAEAYRKIIEASPEGAPWRMMVGTRLAVVQQQLDPTGSSAPALSPEAMRSAEDMTREERAQMVENMVAGLAERLEADGNDLDGWLRLMRAYTVLGKSGEAEQAAASARENFKDDPGALERINSAARQLGLQS